ncbi:hypothetical protein BDW02DRAFT_521314 [Decorospora gaudefroyi]|uniref:Uncharacterized protein n=1 Tax=Decorospora gaudefroyi TaxID=184978 RepID=A0A6A5KM98_9PLEO|nr:hypothetical protein BDW02DRAFT_521314 [Decorospora gaudefroyi]
MGKTKTILLALRVLALVVALAVVGVSAWTKYIVHDIDARGTAILETVRLGSQSTELWQEYYSVVVNGVIRIWISIAAAAFASLAGIIIVLATMLDRMSISPSVLIPTECLCMCAMATSFGTSLSFALSLNAFSETNLDAVTSSDLMMFSMLVDLSKAYAVAAGVGGIFFLVACILALMDARSRAREKESCSFEPTASALGMGHGYAAIVPPASRSRVPTMYDPRLPFDLGNENALETDVEQEKKPAGKDSGSGRADSVVSEEGKISFEFEKEKEKVVTGPINPEQSCRVLQIRPSRPWSERPVTEKVDGGVVLHAM